jgi:hypothetical protein
MDLEGKIMLKKGKRFTQSEKENGEAAMRRLTGLARKYYVCMDSLSVYDVENEGLYISYSDTNFKDVSSGPYTIDQVQREFEGLYRAILAVAAK